MTEVQCKESREVGRCWTRAQKEEAGRKAKLNERCAAPTTIRRSISERKRHPSPAMLGCPGVRLWVSVCTVVEVPGLKPLGERREERQRV